MPMALRLRQMVFFASLALSLDPGLAAAQAPPTVLKASTAFDGRGKILHNTIVVVEGGEIQRVGGSAPNGAVTYDLTRLTVLPGWIDAHVHPTWHFDASGRLAGENDSEEQLAAICSEAKQVGLRTVVHAYGPSVRMASLAGCTEVEHGLYASDADLRLLAERGTYFDPQAGLVLQNYLDNKSHYLGIGNYTETAFETMQKVLPEFQELFRHAIRTRGLKVIFGTDAVAGAHGRNAEEFLYRVQTCGQEPMDALVSANSLAAEALGLRDRVGSLAAGLDADIIALDGDPLKDITAVRRVVFVMKGGTIFVNQAAGSR